MNKLIGVGVVVLGVISSGLFFSSGLQFGKTGKNLTTLCSIGRGSVAELYYQEVGRYGIAYSNFAYALALGSLSLSLGLGGLLIAKKD